MVGGGLHAEPVQPGASVMVDRGWQCDADDLKFAGRNSCHEPLSNKSFVMPHKNALRMVPAPEALACVP